MSTNGGRAWREVKFPTQFAPVLSMSLSPNFADDNVLFVGTESCGLFYSDDRGQSWTRLGEDKITESVNAIVLSPLYPDKPYVLAALSQELLISRDSGKSWSGWKKYESAETILSVAAPLGLDDEALLLVGLLENGVVRI